MLTEEGFGGDRLLRALGSIQQQGPPLTIAGWKAVVEGLLVDERCAGDRNRQISSCYAWAYMALPTTFKWAGMAAIASHHVRVALLPLHLQSSFRGSAAQLRRPGRWRVLTQDANTLRATNNAIFDDLFWVHLAYVTSGIGLLRTLLRGERGYAPVLAAFEALDRGRWVLEDATASPAARGRARDLVWEGNLILLEHEQRFVVQPRFDRLSGRYAPVVSIGSATTFETRGPCRAIEHFTSFYLYTLGRANPRGLGGRLCPRITNYDDRWRWLVSSVVPRFRRVDTDPLVIQTILRRILDEDRHHPSSPCSPSIGGDGAPSERAASVRARARDRSPLVVHARPRTAGRRGVAEPIQGPRPGSATPKSSVVTPSRCTDPR
ncbi:DUF2515 family protein [Auraticoccus monumenti]|uniref:DUF2515 family protein n=1 Tax=Auraticoccus monumenti TaxID=675864 RepID=UPI0012FB3D4B|nr:hypothetical protein [Auraticoccus monumenti]